VLFNAGRSGRLPQRELDQLLPLIATLNAAALDAAGRFEVHACTDITGFGIMGHVMEMAQAGGVPIHLDFSRLPVYPNALEMYRKGETTGSNAANRQMVSAQWEQRVRLGPAEAELLFDPQTSGGLLLSLPESAADELVRELKAGGVAHAARIGAVGPAGPPRIVVG
jgi:selenide,water dikinase